MVDSQCNGSLTGAAVHLNCLCYYGNLFSCNMILQGKPRFYIDTAVLATQFRRQILRPKLPVDCHNHQPLDHIRHFTDVAGP